jgi:hypothetical protein
MIRGGRSGGSGSRGPMLPFGVRAVTFGAHCSRAVAHGLPSRVVLGECTAQEQWHTGADDTAFAWQSGDHGVKQARTLCKKLHLQLPLG